MSEKNLDHVAFIPDGNRRWAKSRGIGREAQVYEKGSETTFDIVKAAFELGIPYVTFWGSSYANLKERNPLLVDAIEAIFARKFHELATDPLIHEHKVKVTVCGEWRTILKQKTVEAIEESIKATQDYDSKYLTVLIGYDGLRERGAAVVALTKALQLGTAHPPENDDIVKGAELLRQHSWTGHLPEVDLVIRTGSSTDPHNSTGFLGLIAGDAQFAFPEVLWPDFTSEMLDDLVDDFKTRDRRMGR
jgi:tritrans,polycis-undecaprenyl-diphosphate synthase [geranylgeranyl-diphosphate specific]